MLENEREYRKSIGSICEAWQVAWHFDKLFFGTQIEFRGSEFGEIGWVHIPKNPQCQIKEFDIIFL